MCVRVSQAEWEEVRKEIVEEKGLEETVADTIGEYVKLNGRFELLERLTSDQRLLAVASAVAGLEDMKLLLQYCDLFGVLDKVCVCEFRCSMSVCVSFIDAQCLCV